MENEHTPTMHQRIEADIGLEDKIIQTIRPDKARLSAINILGFKTQMNAKIVGLQKEIEKTTDEQTRLRK